MIAKLANLGQPTRSNIRSVALKQCSGRPCTFERTRCRLRSLN